MSLDSLVTTIHVLGGATFAVTATLMQTVVGPAMARIPAGAPKAEAAGVIQSRARLAMDIIIVIQSVTAVYLLFTRWEMISASGWLMAKITFGAVALTMALLLHFYWRGKKARLKAAGETVRFEALSSWTLKMEKVVLVAAPAAFIMGVILGHF
ncbi:MAG: hypothetical protein OEZ04_02040 [Nitrospinota bacterium]|nr:hypothetical protein [Nitrospinota bacterium]